MSTRSAIARSKGDGFEGVYHHWDGYPDALGKTLWDTYHGHFNRDLPKMMRFLIDEHPAGWSSINEADFGAEPGYDENGFQTTGPKCYCHGGRAEEAQVIDQDSDAGMEWAYVFADNHVAVLERIRIGPAARDAGFEGQHAVGFAGTLGANSGGEREDRWVIRWSGPLDGAEPNWASLTQ